MSGIKPIETYYKGYRFRSRLEARWAILLDHLNAEWEYEPEGFDMDGLYYLPDFKVTNHAGRGGKELWIEVKGDMTDADREKILRFSEYKPIYVVGDIPKGETFDVITDRMQEEAYESSPAKYNFETVDGDYFGAYPCVTKSGEFELLGDDHNYLCDADREKTARAYTAARQARFEHGEMPPTPPPAVIDREKEREYLAKEFIEKYKHLDVSYGGNKNLNNPPDIKELYIPFLKEHGKEEWFGGTLTIQAWFSSRKEKIMGEILEKDPFITEEEMFVKTHFSMSMIHKFMLKRRAK